MDRGAFEKLFRPGACESWMGERVLELHDAGSLHLRSGRLVACDPICGLGMQPFERSVPRGRHPVVLSVAVGDGDACIAAAMVRFSTAEAVAFEPAVRGDEFDARGYPVDSRKGCFLDADADRALQPRILEGDVLSEISAAWAKRAESGEEWVRFVVDEELDLIAFGAGVGDGWYRTHFGFDARGELVCAVTDFALLAPHPKPTWW